MHDIPAFNLSVLLQVYDDIFRFCAADIAPFGSDIPVIGIFGFLRIIDLSGAFHDRLSGKKILPRPCRLADFRLRKTDSKKVACRYGKIVIVGCGIAGFTAAKNLKEKLPSSEITLVDGGIHGLYSRMRLPETLAGTLPEQKLILASPEAIEKSGIQFLAGVEAVSIQVQQKTLTLADARVLPYDRLVLATGAEPSIPPIEGAGTDMTLRSLEDVQRYSRLLKEGERATVIGGGLLGLEAAHALRERGLKVAVAEFMPRLLPRQLSEKESEILQK